MGTRRTRDLHRRGDVEGLIALLDSNRWRDRVGAAEALGALQAKVAVEPIGHCLTHRHRRVRAAAATALGSIATQRSAGLLTEVMEQPFSSLFESYECSQQAHVIGPAAISLGRLRNELGELPERLHTLLETQLMDQAPEARRLAVQAMGATGDPAFVVSLLRELPSADRPAKGSEVEFVSYLAVDALGRLGDTRAIEVLVRLLEDRDPNVREAAARSLTRLDDRRGILYFEGVLRRDKPRRWVALSSLGRVGGPSDFATVMDFVDDKQAHVRREAAAALPRVGGERARTALGRMREDPDEQVRIAARRSLDALDEQRFTLARSRYTRGDPGQG